MKLLLNENIRNNRKRMSLTQEQLAEAMGVSVATVSKWENGSVSPDVAMLAELADFFQISVDVLLGYKWEKRGMGQCAEYIRELRDERNYEDGVVEVRKALQKYPNSFPVVYECGRLLYLAAENWNRERLSGKREEHLARFAYAREILEKAVELFDQNTDKNITLESIHQDIGMIYAYSFEAEKAISYWEEHNTCNVNDKLIGMILCDMQEFDRAWGYLAKTFQRSLQDLWNSYLGIWGVLLSKEKIEDLLEISKWIRSVYSMAAAEHSSYFWRLTAIADATIVTAYACKEFVEKADYAEELYSYMKLALEEAVRFDNVPDYRGKVRFFSYEGDTMHDTFGDSALDAVQHTLRCCKDEPIENRLTSIYNDTAKSLRLNDFLR